MQKSRTLLVICTLLLLAGCSDSSPANNSNVDNSNLSGKAVEQSLSEIDMKAKVNPKESTVELPGDRFSRLTDSEEGRIGDAFVVARAVCARSIGIDYPVPRLGIADAREYAMFNELGPWTEEMANRFAYTRPGTIADQVYNGYIPMPSGFSKKTDPFDKLSLETLDTVTTKCDNSKDAKPFNQQELYKLRSPAAQELDFDAILKKLANNSNYKKALEDLKQCYQEVGIRLEEKKDGKNTYTEIVGVDYRKINEKQITLALKDVQCKTKVDFVNRVAQEAAKLQAPIIKKNIKEFTAWRAKVDENIKKAEEYIAAHQDVVLK
ncbi:hypothetical protein [Mobiluncus mulieris]|uniref:hypothetical protein n=2 Tax=Mobiluncus mulieris TaxID=2052 RepID=UPI00201E0862|nr:hypothetical protein [Mobiluncus mulieris]